MRWLLIEDRGRALERACDEPAADLLSRKSEAELAAGEEREGDAHDRGPVVLPTDPVLRERDHLFAVLVRGIDMHDCVFFSSRRRHTISLCDWSSDVCSSD